MVFEVNHYSLFGELARESGCLECSKVLKRPLGEAQVIGGRCLTASPQKQVSKRKQDSTESSMLVYR
jgi:hypothetical protein